MIITIPVSGMPPNALLLVRIQEYSQTLWAIVIALILFLKQKVRSFGWKQHTSDAGLGESYLGLASKPAPWWLTLIVLEVAM